MPDPFIEVQISTEQTEYELLSWMAMEAGALGVQELELTKKTVSLKLYFPPDSKQVARALKGLQAALSITVTRQTEQPGQDWQALWRQHFKPLCVGGRLMVRPPWEKNPWPERLELVIDPGQGFGTGYHETTRLALLALESLNLTEINSFLDIGCGSGILGLAALKLGVSQGTGLDIEPEAVAELPLNLHHSGLFSSGFKAEVARPDQWREPADLLLANITGDVLLHHQPDLARLSNRLIILSGIMENYLGPLQKAFVNWGQLSHLTEGDWHCLTFEKPS